tara:strand:- start:567 stop:1010 length:444 start_codon:yes stop_codon:yes gene_type:complete
VLDLDMRRYIVLLLITGIAWAQTGFDKLISKAGTKYLGEYSKLEDKIVYFKPKNALEFQAIPLELIETLKLKDGAVLIQSGRINESTSTFIKFIKEYEKLTIEEKAVYDRKKWFVLVAITAIFGIMFIEGLRFGPWGPGPIFTPPDA